MEKSGSKIYWYAGSEVLDETDLTGSVTNSSFNEYVFFGGNRIARRDSANNVFYYLADQLGSSRVTVQGGQTTFCYDADFEPFGGEHTYTNTCPQNYKFTGKERDTESGLDNFGARYDASSLGRFMTPDWALKPITVPYANFGDPQTLNLYTYVENSPLDRIDADGHGDRKESGEIEVQTPSTPSQCTNGGASCTTTTAQNNQPAPTNPDGTAKPPTNDVPKPPDGKPPGWKPGDPLVPNEWVPGKGNEGDRPTRWDPKYPIPGQSPPNVSGTQSKGTGTITTGAETQLAGYRAGVDKSTTITIQLQVPWEEL